MRTLLEGAGEGEGDCSGVGETEGNSSGVGEGVGVGDSCARSAQAEIEVIRIARLSFFVMSSGVEISLVVPKEEAEEQREIPRLRSE